MKKIVFLLFMILFLFVSAVFAQQCFNFWDDKLCISVNQLAENKYTLQVNIDSPNQDIKFLSCKLLSPTGKLYNFGTCNNKYIITYRDFPQGYSLYINYNLKYSKYIPLSESNVKNSIWLKISNKLKQLKEKLIVAYPWLKNEKKWLLFTNALIEHTEKYAYGNSDKIKTYAQLKEYLKTYVKYTQSLIAKYKS